jgi:hypothetical protein
MKKKKKKTAVLMRSVGFPHVKSSTLVVQASSTVATVAIVVYSSLFDLNHRSMAMEEDSEVPKEVAPEVVYEGTKYFPATESLFHIALVDHALYDTIEVIAYEKSRVVEASRMYLNYSVLLSRISEESIEARYRSIKEQAMKNHAIPDLTRMRKLATCEGIFDFVLQRLFLRGENAAETAAMLEFKLLSQDLVEPRRVGYHVRDLLCEKPYSLEAYAINSEALR